MSFNRNSFGSPSSSNFNFNAASGEPLSSGLGTPQLPSTPRPLRVRPLPLESPGIYDFMDPNLTPIDQELKAGGFGMFPSHVASPGRGSPSIRGGGTGGGDGRGDDGERGGGGGGLLSFSNPELEGYTSAQLYDLNQALLNDSVPTRPLIDIITPMTTLRTEYESGTNNNFIGQIDWLIENGYRFVRRTRGDGDCFYRSLAFAYISSLIHSPDIELSVARALSTLAQTPELLDSAGIEKMVYEDFYDEVVGVVERVVRGEGGGKGMDDEELLKAFQDPESESPTACLLFIIYGRVDDTLVASNAIVIYLRFVTSAHIRMNPDQYEGFVVHPDTREPMDVDSYCANFVQAMGKEADNVEIQALTSILHLNVDVLYLNGGARDRVDVIEFRGDVDAGAEPVRLLYRPGHYDVLLKG
ncbi:hypothetical protein CVT24_010023 [Panaeolus cyanescens]|uniref:ubiquitinyl hydrolase 1 n=1 Tax=Panaeolus cyanescens TaxID=181874 RepID=A0A409W3T5_9AGAR|nr:hypothetical protein CVT24_010023 [Panaeolus cyanescens]